MDFLSEREKMVAEQLVSRRVEDPAVLDAFRAVPREKFVPPRLQSLAYIDAPLDIGQGQTISQPFTVAMMTQLLRLSPADKVLEVGTGSGYQAAILAKMVTGGKVFTIELITSLARVARQTIKDLGYPNVEVIVGDGSQGLPDKAPFDAIIVTAAAPKVPQPLLNQLKVGGRLVIPVGGGLFQEMLRLTKQDGGKLKEERFGSYRFVPLVGEYGWKA